MVYTTVSLDVIRSNIFDAWLSDLKDREARAQIQKRITRMRLGNFGDTKRVAKDVSELWSGLPRVLHAEWFSVGATALWWQ